MKFDIIYFSNAETFYTRKVTMKEFCLLLLAQ